MDEKESIEYGRGKVVKTIVDEGFETLQQELKRAEGKVAAAIRRDAPFRRNKSSPATLLQKIEIQFVSFFYLVEKMIRTIFGSSFASKFLLLFQKLTADSEALIAHKLGQIPIPLPLPVSQADGTGGLSVAMLLTSADQDSVRELLPAGLELIPREELGDMRDQIPAGKHPVMVGLGFNSDVRPVWMTAFVRMNYLELTIGVPGVRLTRDFGEPRGPYFYIPSLLLNAITPTVLGWLFGFKKRLKRIKADARSYRIFHLISGQPLLTAEVTMDPNGSLQFATSIKELAPWLALLDQPIVTRTWWGDLKFTFFHWDWMLTPTAPAQVKILFCSDEISLVPKGPSIFTSIPDYADTAASGGPPVLGKAYLMSVPWRLLLPFGRDALRGKPSLWHRMFGQK